MVFLLSSSSTTYCSIANTAEEADALYARTLQVLDKESAYGL